jgi:putative selenium metabolism protein SsnA
MLITNARLITWEEPNRILTGNAIYIKDGLIEEIGSEKGLVEKYPFEETINAHSQLVMPGNICAHTHFYSAFARGLAIPGTAPADFPQILQRLWWPLDKSLTAEDIRYSALVCLLDAIKHGSTTLIDHHASPNAIDGSLDEISDAVKRSGLRAALCYEVTDRDGEQKTRQGIVENIRFINRIKSGDHLGSRLSATFGLHASLTLSEKTLDMCREATSKDTGFHIHVAEHPIDESDSVKKTGLRVINRLQRHGMLGPQTIVVHAVHINSDEIAILAETNTWVTHQPRSNMNNAVGLPAVEEMLASGIRVCLGNDGFSNAMWEEWKACYLSHKLISKDPRKMSADKIVRMAIYNNAALAKVLFPEIKIGVLAPGAQADLIFVDYEPYTNMTPENFPWHIVFGFHESMITHTMVKGVFLMRDRKVLSLEEEEIYTRARQLSQGVWQRFSQQY